MDARKICQQAAPLRACGRVRALRVGGSSCSMAFLRVTMGASVPQTQRRFVVEFFRLVCHMIRWGPVLGLHGRTREVMENLAAENSATTSPYARIREVMGKNPK